MTEQKDVELTSCHKHVKNTPTRGTILKEYLPSSSRYHTIKSATKNTTYSGMTKRKEKESGPGPLGGSCEGRTVPSPWEPPTTAGRSAGAEGSFRGSEERVAAGLRQKEQRETRAHCPQHRPALPSSRRFCCCVQEMGAETRASADRPGETTAVSRQPEEAGACQAATGSGCKMEPESGIKVPSLTGEPKGGLGSHHSSLLPGVPTVAMALPT